jgi:hypothetical protein
MMKNGWHATKEPLGILLEGKVRPARLRYVYLFTTWEAAWDFCNKFSYTHICKVEYDTKDVGGRWSPAYVENGMAIRMKRGKSVKLIEVVL